MKTKISATIVLAVFVLTLSGCGNNGVFNRKFVRKNAKPEGPPKIFNIEPFVKPPNTEIYKHAFLFWDAWIDELTIALSHSGPQRTVNVLKLKECLNNAVSNLKDMKNCLNDKKAQELDIYIKQLEDYSKAVDAGYISDGSLSRLRDDVETNKRNVSIRFSFSEIKNDIKEDSSEPESN